MTIHEKFPLQAETLLPGQDYAVLRQIILHKENMRNLSLLEDSANQIIFQSSLGLVCFAEVNSQAIVTLHADKPDRLYLLKENLTKRLVALADDLPGKLRWSGNEQAGGLPANFHFATVQSVTFLCSTFLRISIKADDLSSFGDNAIHFRLALPPEREGDPVWPHLGENGVAVWPKGDTALHRPVYTTRRIDRDTGEMDFDVFIHEGGRVTNWAQAAKPGDRCALTGPGGGGIPQTDQIMIYADETALPAVARILETLPNSVTGRAVLLTDDGQENGYPIPQHDGIKLTWLKRLDGHNLAEIAIRERAETPTHYWWFASERSDTMRVRAVRKEEDKDSNDAYIASYWSKPDA